MARTLRKHFADAACCVLHDGNLLVSIIAGTATVSHIRHIQQCRTLMTHSLRDTKPFGLHMVNVGANRSVPSDVRQAVQELALEAKGGSSAVVLCGEGLAVSLIRSVLTAASVMAKVHTRIFSDLLPALQWTADYAQPPLVPGDIESLTELLNKEYRERTS